MSLLCCCEDGGDHVEGMGSPTDEGNPGQQLTRNLGSQSYKHKKLDYRNKWNEPESGSFPGACRLEPAQLSSDSSGIH